MAAGNSDKKPKMSGMSVAAVVIVFLVLTELPTVLSVLADGSETISESLITTWIVFALLILLILFCVRKSNKKKKNTDAPKTGQNVKYSPSAQAAAAAYHTVEGRNEAHSHDRLTGHIAPESRKEHWKSQLDGFLKAGLIDRAEYTALWEKYKDQL